MADEALQAKIEELELELKNTKVNKRTEMAVGQLKGKIAKLKEELEAKSKGGGRGEGFAVKKEGDATVGLLGKPSVGKSTLLGKVTNKESKIGAYEFTTLDCVPGLLHHRHTNLQILDLPGIIDKAADNRGFGKKVLSVVRACDLVVLVIDARRPVEDIEMLIRETENSQIKFNQEPPNIQVRRMSHGAINIPLNNSSDHLSNEMVEEMLKNMGYVNAEVIIHEKNATTDDIIEACHSSVVYKKAVFCLNKIDLFSVKEMKEIRDMIQEKYPKFELFGISAEAEVNIEKFKDFIWDQLGFMWIYLKEQRKDPDLEKPLVVMQGDTVKDVCEKIHKDMLDKFKYAKLKGTSAKFDWQRVALEHKVEHEDIIEIYAR
ncbi:MAG: OBG GTPase family GTP-binding protein [Candidatus Woesearchaeota archaeon]